MSRILSLLLILVLAISGFAAFRLLEASLAAQVYRDRLAELGFVFLMFLSGLEMDFDELSHASNGNAKKQTSLLKRPLLETLSCSLKQVEI